MFIIGTELRGTFTCELPIHSQGPSADARRRSMSHTAVEGIAQACIRPGEKLRGMLIGAIAG
jgi:hypothetical protein